MAEVLCLRYSENYPLSILDSIANIDSTKFVPKFWDESKLNDVEYTPNYFDQFHHLISYLFKKGNDEYDTNHATIIVIDEISCSRTAETLDNLLFEDKSLLLKYFFNHLNIIVVTLESLKMSKIRDQLNSCIAKINFLIHNRIGRVQTWTGTGSQGINDYFADQNYLNNSISSKIKFEIDEVISTMSFVLQNNINTSNLSKQKIIGLKNLIINEVDFKGLLSNHSHPHLYKLCHLVGHWSFPAHELTNDDLIYCVFLMVKFSLDQLKHLNNIPSDFHFLTENELLGFVFMVRDTYKNGNPFHNFRHAVDVLQACFHYLIKLGCLPEFRQLESDPKANELLYLADEADVIKSLYLIRSNDSDPAARTNKNDITISTTTTSTINTQASTEGFSKRKSVSVSNSEPHLNPLQTLGLLISAIGHDVGHPGVTNAFMIQYDSPTSLVYNERSVLELFHASVFINKILSINWAGLLKIETDPDSKLTFKQLIVGSILATDMAEHFEYIDKITSLKLDKAQVNNNKVKLISSLLIKCADISNVTRPLRVSSQWSLVLAREFDEVSMLEKKINNTLDQSLLEQEITYDKIPLLLEDVLTTNQYLHKGQIFFIDTFAENLFNSIVDLLPELRFTCEIIKENKAFWLTRAASS